MVSFWNIYILVKTKKMSEYLHLKDQTSNPGPLGLFGFALTTILLNIHNAGFYQIDVMIMGMGIFFGGFAQFCAGVMEWKRGNQFGSVAFMSYGAFWLTLVFIWIATACGLPKPDSVSMGCYLFMWGLFTLVFFLQTFNGLTVGKILFGLLFLLFMLLAIYNFTGIAWIGKLAGFEGILCGFVAFYEASAIMINQKYNRNILPM